MIVLKVTNERLKSAVKVVHSEEDAAALGIDTSIISMVSIQRREKGKLEWTEVKKSTSLNFEFLDYTALAHKVYEYRSVITADSIYTTDVTTVVTKFDGILLANYEKCYIALLDPKYTYQREFNNAYVKPYNSQYPHVVRNGIANSARGTAEGCFNPINENCEFELKYADYIEEIIDFMTDGSSKILKTPDGHCWYVQIDTPVKTSNDNRIDGVTKIHFSWTEVGKVPVNINSMLG